MEETHVAAEAFAQKGHSMPPQMARVRLKRGMVVKYLGVPMELFTDAAAEMAELWCKCWHDPEWLRSHVQEGCAVEVPERIGQQELDPPHA